MKEIKEWFKSKGWKAFPFQEKTWEAYLSGYHGLINAPTGSGKTYSILLPILQEAINRSEDVQGVQLMWVTPIRALAKEIKLSAERAVSAMNLDWQVAIRSGDTTTAERKKQLKSPPEILIITPESIHVLLATKGHKKMCKNLQCIVIDEWHELIGSKRGVQVELALSRLLYLSQGMRIWGISATIGNLQEAIDVLLYPISPERRRVIKSDIDKKITLESFIPDEIERYPWSGHLGLKMIDNVLDVIHKSKTTLIFTNTRSQCEIWYQKILAADEDLAGLIAMHHGSISRELRAWVEDELYAGRLKAVVCTSSLDLGVDFRPVESVIQIGSPKGVARFIQRAGRSGHQPGMESKIYFAPTHAIELIEAAALREAIANQSLEARLPYIRSFDVLIQYLMTLAVSDGFDPEEVYDQVKKTYSFESLSEDEWLLLLDYLIYGTDSLKAYEQYKKLEWIDGKFKVSNRSVAQKHRLSIGTIVSSTMLSVSFVNGKRIGTIEESFISRLSPGEVFWFAGQALEVVRIKDMNLQVKRSKRKSGPIPSYAGGRLPLSNMMSKVLQEKIYQYAENHIVDPEIKAVSHLLELQKKRSVIPRRDEFLVEYFNDKEGWHLLFYPFEGRFVHEGMAALVARRLARDLPISFSLAMNDYGFELLSDQEIDVELLINKALFSTADLYADIQSSINSVEMARRKFRDIAKISGLIFSGYPGRRKKERHLQSSAQLLFDVFKAYEPDNLLFQQTYDEVLTFQLEESRLRDVLERIQRQQILISTPDKATPLSFPIIVDRLSRDRLTSETIQDRIRKMRLELEND